MAAQNKVAIVTGAGSGIGKAVALAFLKDGYSVAWRADARTRWNKPLRKPARTARAPWRCPRTWPKPDQWRPCSPPQKSLRPARRAVQQCRRERAGRSARGPHIRAVEERGGHQPDRHVPVHAGRIPHNEGSGATRRPHHQQRLDLGPRAAPELSALHLHQACRDRIDQVRLAGRPQVRHRVLPDRHRQCADRNGGAK